MTIKQRKLIVHFLRLYKAVLEENSSKTIHPIFTDFFSRSELVKICQSTLHGDDIFRNELEGLENEEILRLIGSNLTILSFIISELEKGITATPTLSKSEVETFFDKCGLQTHYLRDKPSEEWDGYDRSNYYSLLFKHGKTKRVFAIFTTDVDEKDKYAVTTQPSYFFDTEEEAEEELEKILLERDFKRDELKIMSLWQIN